MRVGSTPTPVPVTPPMSLRCALFLLILEWLYARRIGLLVNDVANEGPALIEPVPEESVHGDGQLRLWEE